MHNLHNLSSNEQVWKVKQVKQWIAVRPERNRHDGGNKTPDTEESYFGTTIMFALVQMHTWVKIRKIEVDHNISVIILAQKKFSSLSSFYSY